MDIRLLTEHPDLGKQPPVGSKSFICRLTHGMELHVSPANGLSYIINRMGNVVTVKGQLQKLAKQDNWDKLLDLWLSNPPSYAEPRHIDAARNFAADGVLIGIHHVTQDWKGIVAQWTASSDDDTPKKERPAKKDATRGQRPTVTDLVSVPADLGTLSSTELRSIAKGRVHHWQWANKGDLIILLTEGQGSIKYQEVQAVVDARHKIWADKNRRGR